MFLKLYNSYFDVNENKAKPISELLIPLDINEDEKEAYIDSQRLAFISESPVNWCPELGTVLANEEVPEQIEKGFTVVRKAMKQWKLRITKYAQRLLDDLDKLQWPENIKKLQMNWIGRSDGAIIKFRIKSQSTSTENDIEVFTTRPDTLFGASYMVFSPEHKLIKDITTPDHKEAVDDYIEAASRKSDLERSELSKDKTGVFTGAYAVNPANNLEIPVYISDYVLMSYGTGAIMSVPGHDDRDMEFANKFDIEIIPVVAPEKFKDVAFKKISSDAGDIIISGKGLEKLMNGASKEFSQYLDEVRHGKKCFTDEGYAVNSGFLTGLKTAEAKEKMIVWLEEKGIGRRNTNFRLRDWLFSRQRFWGEPFPLVYHADGSISPLEENDLPVVLPNVSSYTTSKTGESPLSLIDEWVNTEFSGQAVKRETNTMPQWAGSCWYFLRYIDPKNKDTFCDIEKEKYWMPVDLYIGGSEHAVLHLLYARFWHKVLFDLGYVTSSEPFGSLFNQGMILGEDGVKMSKSRGNVINPDDMIEQYGADSVRLFEMFMGPLEATKPWSNEGIAGIHRFLSRVWRLIIDEFTSDVNTRIIKEPPSDEQKKLLHTTIKKLTKDIEDGDMKFNTSIAQMMIFINELYKADTISLEVIEKFILLLAPYAPHLAEEIWHKLGHQSSLAYEKWPAFNEEFTKSSLVTVAFSVNGKVRAKKEVEYDMSEKDLEQNALDEESVKKHIYGKQVIKIIIVRNKMVNVVVK
ncbi:MAG: class I tRNA ligase family protein [Ignavibacteriota bacterium]